MARRSRSAPSPMRPVGSRIAVATSSIRSSYLRCGAGAPHLGIYFGLTFPSQTALAADLRDNCVWTGLSFTMDGRSCHPEHSEGSMYSLAPEMHRSFATLRMTNCKFLVKSV